MKRIIIFIGLLTSTSIFSQITFKGCTDLFDDQYFTFNETGIDGNGRKIFMTTPITGDQPCGGLGTCEFKIEWNDTSGRWDFLADTGNGDFINPYLIYYSTSGNSSENNPPNISIGSWTENVADTGGLCGGNLTTSNATMTGDVRSSTLDVEQNRIVDIAVFPNPVKDFLTVAAQNKVRSLLIYNSNGQLILIPNKTRIDVSNFSAGIYYLKIKLIDNTEKTMKFIKK